jgi:hypothetical protein
LNEPKRSISPESAKDLGSDDEWVEKEPDSVYEDVPPNDETLDELLEAAADKPSVKRDDWMEAPSAMDIDYTQRKKKEPEPNHTSRSLAEDYQLKLHKNEINHLLKDLKDDGELDGGIEDEPAQHEVKYEFGDSGSQWRMTKLQNIYREAKESGRPVDDVALEKLGDLRDFDDLREEEIELDRRKRLGDGYVGKVKPSGELFQERKMKMGIRRASSSHKEPTFKDLPQGEIMPERSGPEKKAPLDATALNKMKLRVMKAQLRKDPKAAELESEYNALIAEAAETATTTSANQTEPGVVILNAMENRMLAGNRSNEVAAVNTKRGRERGLVEENEDMSIEDMVRQERRTRGQGAGLAMAERIAKDSKFDTDLDYMDDNAAKLAKRVAKSEINLRNTAIADFQKMNRILDRCPLCYHEDSNKPPLAPVVSLGHRTYLTLSTEPEIAKDGCVIVPVQHHTNLLECDDDEWDEIRNFMKSLARFYHSRKQSVIFYENAAFPNRKRHAALNAVPIPRDLHDNAPAFFRESFLTTDEEWSQHKKVIDTAKNAKEQGWGKSAFRRSIAKEAPYFHVWFDLDGGLGHVVEDAEKWPKGDLFARQVLGGMLDVDIEVVNRQGRWKGQEKEKDRVEKFRKAWTTWDWTKMLAEET